MRAGAKPIRYVSLVRQVWLQNVVIELVLSVVFRVMLICRLQILSKLEQALRHQIRHEYNKTGRHSNVTNIKADHVTIVLDLIQVKVSDIKYT